MKRLPLGPLYYEFSRHNEPRLRIDRELEWRAIAQIMSDESLDDDALTREAASLRKRFERLKEKLKWLAATEPACRATATARPHSHRCRRSRAAYDPRLEAPPRSARR